MVINTVFGLNSSAKQFSSPPPNFVSRVLGAVSRQMDRIWCGMHGHLILLHFAPNKLSLQCALCGYESEGWEVGRPPIARNQMDKRVHSHQVRTERRRPLHAVPSDARLAS